MRRVHSNGWWSAAYAIGYEHTFTNMADDILKIMSKKPPVVPMSDFEDTYKTQRVLEAAYVWAKKMYCQTDRN